jgi:chromosome segregation ATPase
MNESEIKPHIDRLKKDPSLNEILNFTQAIIKKMPEGINETATENIEPAEKNKLNVDTLNSLMTTAQSFVNPTTLTLLSKAIKQTEVKDESSEITSLKLEFEQLSAEMSEIKEELNQTKTQLAEKIQRLEELETTVQYLKRRRRR